LEKSSGIRIPFLVVLGFEFRPSHLLDRHSIIWTIHQPCLCWLFSR
jgi:hypothetical protein